MHSLILRPGRASQLGPSHCVENETIIISKSRLKLYVLPGTVCIECSVGGEVASDTIFQIDVNNIDANIGRVVDGVLVVFDTGSVFNTFSHTDVRADLTQQSCFWKVSHVMGNHHVCSTMM